MTKHKVRRLNMENRLKELRKSQGLTLKDTVQKMKKQESLIITADALAKYERGDREPKIETWQKFADFFKVSVPYLQGFDENKSNRLKKLRDKKRVSQGDLAKATGLTRQAISNYENNERNPNEKIWQQLADYFEVSVSYIKGEIDTEHLEKLIELAIFFCFPKTTLTYGKEELDDEFKPFIIIGILSRMLSSLGYDSKNKFQKVYQKAIHIVDDQITFGFLNDFKCVVDETMAKTEGITNNLLQAYENL